MLQYVDGFACSLNESKDKMVIKFVQSEPIFPDDEEGGEIEIVKNQIASIVIDTDCARGLISSLAQMLEEE